MFSRAFTFAILAVAASAANICTWSTRTCGVGSWGCCNNIPANTCCYWGSGTPYGWSTRFSNMPNPNPPAVTWMGYTYGDICSTKTGGGAASGGSVCLSVYNGPTYLAAQSAAWFNTGTRTTANASANCRTPDKIGFVTADGTAHEVAVPEGQFENMSKLVREEKYDVLLAFSK